MILPNQLKPFGLTEKEAKIYLSALELGTDSVQNIAKKAQVHRVSCYDILEKLIKHGLIEQNIKGKKRYFSAVEPDKILEQLKTKQFSFENLLPELQALQNQTSQKPKILHYFGKESVWQAYLDRIRHHDVKENLVYGSSEKLLTTFPQGFKEFTQERLLKNIPTKIIVEKSKSGLKEKATGEKELRQVKFLPEDKNLKTNTIIYGNRVMIVSWQNMSLTIIEDQNYADSQRLVFNLLWESL